MQLCLRICNNLSDGSDYYGGIVYVNFLAGETIICRRFYIIDDNIQEQFEETFSVCIESAPPGVDTTSGNTTTTVVIQDDDSEFGQNTTGHHVSYFGQ